MQADTRVSSLELFFDLVFVFTLTQLTSILVHHPSAAGLARVVLILGIVFWMYGGYAWLTNAIAVDRPAHRLLLLGGMGGFLVLALTIPTAFGGSGLTFGLAYLFIVLLHTFLYSRAASAPSARAILGLAPYNLVSAALVLTGGALGGTAQWVLWTAGFALEWCTPYIAGVEGFEVAPGHFVERHGLVIIIALGESVVAVGIGAAGLPVDAGLIVVALLGLALSACLWWTYFEDEDRIEAALTAAPPERRPWIAINGFGYAHVLMLLGVVLVATGIEAGLAHPGDPVSTALAIFLSSGAALFLLGDVWFRATLGTPFASRGRVVAALAALVVIPLGTQVAVEVQLLAIVGLLVGGLVLDAE